MRKESAAKIILSALWIICVYRAVTQSVVHDEAFTYLVYLAGPWSAIFQTFSPNHHFLNTLLMRVSVAVFGLSEWSLRLPALAGAALYFAAIYRLSRYMFGSGYTFLLAVPLLTMNPLILDFMVAARGYGMALALWMWALALLLPYIEQPKERRPRKLVEAAVALSLSAVANLVFVVPAGVLAVTMMWLLRKRPPARPVKKAKRAQAAEPSLTVWFVLPILSAALLFLLVSPLESAKSADLYAGAPTIPESLKNLAAVSLTHSGPFRHSAWIAWAVNGMAYVLAPLILLAGFALGAIRRNLPLIVVSISAIGSALLLLLIHLVFNLPLPADRTGIYFLPLVPLTLLGLAAGEGGVAADVVSAMLLLAFVSQWNVRKFLIWEYDADAREIVGRLSALVTDKRPNSVRVGSSWQLEPTLNFYRQKNQFVGMQPVSRAPLDQAFDYYVVSMMDRPVMDRLGLKPLYQGQVSGTSLAAYPK
jgi:hypothetical protein